MFNATCSPGPNSAVSIRWETSELPELVLDLDPGSVAIHLPPAADGDVVLSRFLREISREAVKLATALEARRIKGVPPDEPITSRHLPQTPDKRSEHFGNPASDR
jgi:hypothetical protein